jgi:hypothetical protein
LGSIDESDRINAFALCHVSHNLLRLARAWILHDFFVDPATCCQVRVRQLLDVVHAAGACEAVLSTAQDNHATQSLCAGAGYQLDDKFRVYVRNPR